MNKQRFWACDGSWAFGDLWAFGEACQLFSVWIGLTLLMCSDELAQLLVPTTVPLPWETTL